MKGPDQAQVDGRVGTRDLFYKLLLVGDVRPTVEAGQAHVSPGAQLGNCTQCWGVCSPGAVTRGPGDTP